MMTRSMNFTLSIFVIFLELGIVCVGATAQTARVDSKNPPNGQLLVKRKKVEMRVGRNSKLEEMDQIQAGEGVQAIVVCPNGKTQRVPKKWIGMNNLCLGWKSSDNKGSALLLTASRNDPTLPYLITPRQSLILNSTPVVRWNPVIGASQYYVQLRDAQGVVWETRTNKTQIQYPGKPALKPGIPYSFIIKTDTGKSSETDTKLLPQFYLLLPSEIESINAAVQAMQRGEGTAMNKALQIAELYGTYTLPENRLSAYSLVSNNSESYSLAGTAIELLETVAKDSPDSFIVWQELGNLYRKEGLELLAIQRYQRAIALTRGSEDLDVWARTQNQLAEAYCETYQPKTSLEHYQLARWGFMFLDNQDAVNRVGKKIKELTLPSTQMCLSRPLE